MAVAAAYGGKGGGGGTAEEDAKIGSGPRRKSLTSAHLRYQASQPRSPFQLHYVALLGGGDLSRFTTLDPEAPRCLCLPAQEAPLLQDDRHSQLPLVPRSLAAAAHTHTILARQLQRPQNIAALLYYVDSASCLCTLLCYSYRLDAFLHRCTGRRSKRNVSIDLASL
jgi:hypothetical protein